MNNGNCCKDVRTKIAKANLAFSRLNNICVIESWDYQSRYGCTVHLYRESNPSLQCWNLGFDQNRDSPSRGCTPEVAEKDSKRLMERYGSQQKYSGANWPREVGAVSPGTSVGMAGARAEDEWWQNSKTSATLGTWRQKRARSATCHLATCCRQWPREGRTVLEEAMSLTADRREWRNRIAQCARHRED